jgi:hypothetical protein
MKPTLAHLTLVVALAATALSSSKIVLAAADPTSQLMAIYTKTDAALDRKDIDSAIAYHSPNFIALTGDGTVETTDQQKTRMMKLLDEVTTLDVTTRIDKCDFADKTATVIISQHITATITDPDTQKAVPMSGDDQARELWSKGASGWQLDVVQTLQAAHLTPDE